jgi:hypothetical protein
VVPDDGVESKGPSLAGQQFRRVQIEGDEPYALGPRYVTSMRWVRRSGVRRLADLAPDGQPGAIEDRS